METLSALSRRGTAISDHDERECRYNAAIVLPSTMITKYLRPSRESPRNLRRPGQGNLVRVDRARDSFFFFFFISFLPRVIFVSFSPFHLRGKLPSLFVRACSRIFEFSWKIERSKTRWLIGTRIKESSLYPPGWLVSRGRYLFVSG